MKRRLNEVYVKHTKKNYEIIEKTLDRDYFMTADQAKDFGLIDKVIKSRDEAEAMLTPSKPVQGRARNRSRRGSAGQSARRRMPQRFTGIAWRPAVATSVAIRVAVRPGLRKEVLIQS